MDFDWFIILAGRHRSADILSADLVLADILLADIPLADILAPGLATLIVLAAAATGDAAAAGAAGAPAAVKQKKRKPKFSPNPHEDPTSSQEEKDDDMDNFAPPPPPAPLEGLRSPTEPFTYTELEDMHNKIVQKCAPLIDGFGALNIYEVSYVEQKLKEIKSAFKKDYDRNNQYVKFFQKVNKQGKAEVNDDVKGGTKGRKKK